MHLRMRAPAERIFALAADVEHWPQLLPHYRYVRRLPAINGERRFAMGARRGLIPLRWEAIQRPSPARRTIEFSHVGGVTRGMEVAWRLQPVDGAVDVSIEHELDTLWPLMDRVVASFVEAVAGRTLRRIKALAEAER
ncbi:MAG: SRPBCC family protein [Chloroflexota bacterium]|nr:SRPBCC family protein [Chloroflexota bacterium]